MSEQPDEVMPKLHEGIRAFLDNLHEYQKEMHEAVQHIENLVKEAQALTMPRVEAALNDAVARVRTASRALDDAQQNITPLLADTPPSAFHEGR